MALMIPTYESLSGMFKDALTKHEEIALLRSRIEELNTMLTAAEGHCDDLERQLADRRIRNTELQQRGTKLVEDNRGLRDKLRAIRSAHNAGSYSLVSRQRIADILDEAGV